jgi:hypothetical protein
MKTRNNAAHPNGVDRNTVCACRSESLVDGFETVPVLINNDSWVLIGRYRKERHFIDCVWPLFIQAIVPLSICALHVVLKYVAKIMISIVKLSSV